MLLMIGTLLPITLAAALSTVPFLATVLLLLAPHHKRTALPFMIGYLVGTFIVAGAFTLGFSALPPRVQRGDGFAYFEILLGAALVVAALVQRRRTRREDKAESAWWSKRIDRLGPASALGFSLVMSLRPKAFLLAAAAGIAISTSSRAPQEALIGLAFYTLLGTATVSVPIVTALVRPTVMNPRLRRAEGWITTNGNLVTFIVMLMVGTVIISDGLIRLGA